jgi:hypothetical protein
MRHEANIGKRPVAIGGTTDAQILGRFIERQSCEKAIW